MNKRIKELILEAGFPKFDEMYVVSDGKELEKFAELIIKECANVMVAKYEKTDYYSARISENVCEQILKHFGVEE